MNDGARLATTVGAVVLAADPVRIEQDSHGDWHAYLALHQVEASGTGPTHQEAIAALILGLAAHLPSRDQQPGTPERD